MFEHATARSFERYLDHVIRTRLGEQEVELKLIEIRLQDKAWTRPASADEAIPPRQPFSLIFEGPREPVLLDDTYTFSHPELERFDLFVSPYHQTADATFYESAFS